MFRNFHTALCFIRVRLQRVVPRLTCHVNDSSLVGRATAISTDILVIRGIDFGSAC